ncbi:MAG: YebC/PmpR family DNA-binding transcriptional regulator [Phycisphaerales bacterium]|nr:YebC/PmpR family DNA-binding transcriptional regulator [Phycisphaerales bacterium]
MAGHSHWKNIKRKKAVIDARRGQAWSKIARLIMIAAKRGSNPDDNLALRFAIDKARAVNMPNDTIDKAVKKGSGEMGSVNFDSVLYEGYGPGGVAILVDALTDNRNRTAGEVRMIFDKHNGNVAGANAVGWMFAKKGVINIEKSKIDEDKLMELALDAGAEDVVTSEEGYEVTTAFQDFEKVRQALLAAKIELASADLAMIPSQSVAISGENAEKLHKIIDGLEANDDVQNVYNNAELPE